MTPRRAGPREYAAVEHRRTSAGTSGIRYAPVEDKDQRDPRRSTDAVEHCRQVAGLPSTRAHGGKGKNMSFVGYPAGASATTGKMSDVAEVADMVMTAGVDGCRGRSRSEVTAQTVAADRRAVIDDATLIAVRRRFDHRIAVPSRRREPG